MRLGWLREDGGDGEDEEEEEEEGQRAFGSQGESVFFPDDAFVWASGCGSLPLEALDCC